MTHQLEFYQLYLILTQTAITLKKKGIAVFVKWGIIFKKIKRIIIIYKKRNIHT